jgi:hypothetical protein
LNGRVEPIGSTFNPAIWFLDSGESTFADYNKNTAGVAEELHNLTISSTNPILRVSGYTPDSKTRETYYYGASWFNYYGAYTVYLGCTLRNGTVINPGDTTPDTNTNSGNNSAPAAPTFSGTGFPGLAPVDFVDAVTTDLNLGQATKGKLPAGANAVLGYTFVAAANDNLAFSFNRVSGNLNLGLVVLSADNKVIFQASLVTASKLNAEFTLPTAGTYTIGIYRIDLLPPDAPEATAFQISVTLNP